MLPLINKELQVLNGNPFGTTHLCVYRFYLVATFSNGINFAPPGISETLPTHSVVKLTEANPYSVRIFEQCMPVFVAAFLAQEIERFGQEPNEFDEEDVEKITADLKKEMSLAQSMEEVLSCSWNWPDRVDEKNNETYLVYEEHEGIIVGFALFIQPLANPTQITLDILAIMPAHQGHRFSRSLIFGLLDSHPEIQSITLEALSFYANAHRIYEHLKFHNEGKDPWTGYIRFTWYR